MAFPLRGAESCWGCRSCRRRRKRSAAADGPCLPLRMASATQARVARCVCHGWPPAAAAPPPPAPRRRRGRASRVLPSPRASDVGRPRRSGRRSDIVAAVAPAENSVPEGAACRFRSRRPPRRRRAGLPADRRATSPDENPFPAAARPPRFIGGAAARERPAAAAAGAAVPPTPSAASSLLARPRACRRLALADRENGLPLPPGRPGGGLRPFRREREALPVPRAAPAEREEEGSGRRLVFFGRRRPGRGTCRAGAAPDHLAASPIARGRARSAQRTASEAASPRSRLRACVCHKDGTDDG